MMSPVSFKPETVTFVYVDPGYETDRDLVPWESSHALLWRACAEGAAGTGSSPSRMRRSSWSGPTRS